MNRVLAGHDDLGDFSKWNAFLSKIEFRPFRNRPMDLAGISDGERSSKRKRFFGASAGNRFPARKLGSASWYSGGSFVFRGQSATRLTESFNAGEMGTAPSLVLYGLPKTQGEKVILAGSRRPRPRIAVSVAAPPLLPFDVLARAGDGPPFGPSRDYSISVPAIMATERLESLKPNAARTLDAEIAT